VAQIPVCFDQNVAHADPNFAVNSVRVRVQAITSWSKFAKIDFTGWGTCGTNRNGMIVVHLIDVPVVNSEGVYGGYAIPIGYPGANAPSTITIDTKTGILDATIVHEFGHALGFSHEMARPGFSSSLPNCHQAPQSGGNYLDTPPDVSSIMAAGYCDALGASPALSFWDIWGLQNAYGIRYGGIKQVATAWNSSRTDYNTASTSERPSVDAQGYQWLYADGWLYARQAPGTVPLQRYWNASRNDYFTTATPEGINSAIGAGYTFSETLGYVYPTQPQGTTTAALKLYWKGSSQDNLTTANEKAQAAALADGYTFVRIEGYVFDYLNVPFEQIWQLSNPSTGDTVSADLLAGSLGMQLLTSGWSITSIDGGTINQPVPGTSAANVFWNASRGDYVLLAAEQDKSAFAAAGYVSTGGGGAFYLDLVGYLFGSQYDPSPTSYVIPYQRYPKGTRDNFTTSSGAGWAASHGYGSGTLQGYGLAQDPTPTAFGATNVISDYNTVCTVGGINMHCCPTGYAMVGANLGSNVFKCAQPSGGLSGARTLGLISTQGIAAACPKPTLMVGFHADLNRVACQTSITFDIANGTTGSTTYIDRCTYDNSSSSMRVCPYLAAPSTSTAFMAGYDQTNSTLRCVNPANLLPAFLSGPACNPVADQFPTLGGYDDGPENAVDGNLDGDFTHGSVTHTDGQYAGDYWYVDLGTDRTITGVSIYNRTDCCSERLGNFTVFHQTTGENAWIPDVSYTASTSGVISIQLGFGKLGIPEPYARYLLIQKNDQNFLSLAEVQVLGY
jgi:hypothetical protein